MVLAWLFSAVLVSLLADWKCVVAGLLHLAERCMLTEGTTTPWRCPQVAQMAAADGRQSSGDQSEAAAELMANTSHQGLTKQTSQPVSASQQDTGGLYTNGSAGVGARSSTGAQKALTMEDLQVCSRHDSSGLSPLGGAMACRL